MPSSLAEINRASYPGLNEQSITLWRKWLKYYESDFASYDYNVPVGQGIKPRADLSEADKALWKRLTQKRIDVIAHRWDSDWIIEIQERADLRSLGQVIGYEFLARKYLTLRQPVRMAFICARLGHDMGEMMAEQELLIFFFPVGKPPVFPPTYEPGALPLSPGQKLGGF